MPGWLSFAGSGPFTSMLSNATSTAWSKPRHRKGRQSNKEKPTGPNRERNKGESK